MLKPETKILIQKLKHADNISFELDIFLDMLSKYEDKDNSFSEKIEMHEFEEQIVGPYLKTYQNSYINNCIAVIRNEINQRENDIINLFNNQNIKIDAKDK